MAICYIDAFAGLAGDMLVGAFADAGANRDAITAALQGLATGGSVTWDTVSRRGLAATKDGDEVHSKPPIESWRSVQRLTLSVSVRGHRV